MLGCSIFWLITGGKLDWPIIKLIVLASYFWKLNTFLNFTINGWDWIGAWRLIDLKICNRIIIVAAGLKKHISDLCNLHVYLSIYSRQ